MTASETVSRLIASRRDLGGRANPRLYLRKSEAEGGCGVIGIASSVPIPGRHLLQALRQMRNRGNGKGGGAALVGLDPAHFGVSAGTLRDDHLLALAYLDPAAKAEVERQFLAPGFIVDHECGFPQTPIPGLGVRPPEVVGYFVRVRPEALEDFVGRHGLTGLPASAAADEFVYQNTYRLNKAFYASLGEKRAFVLSHGKDMLVLKMVGYGDDVIRTYQLEDVRAHVWIGHHRYPTKGRVWHPGGAHPFVGMHEALVHNGDFANYTSVCTYLAQQNIHPLFLTDTEVSVLVFDLLQRTYGYPLEYVIESLAPTTERDFALLPPEKQEIYRRLQTVHIHGSPDGPWFFLIAQSKENDSSPRHARLVGITDTSMLRPQVFALQHGGAGDPAVGFAASEKQAIDAALSSLAAEDARFWSRPDLVWNARGGSHTDGGAFIFDVQRDGDGSAELICTDKFGRRIRLADDLEPYRPAVHRATPSPVTIEGPSTQLFAQVVAKLPCWTYSQVGGFLADLTESLESDASRRLALETLTLLLDRRYPTGRMRRSSLLSLYDESLERLFNGVCSRSSAEFLGCGHTDDIPPASSPRQWLVMDARGFEPEGPASLARAVVEAVHRGFHFVMVVNTRGHRFIGAGLGPDTTGVRIEVYGSSGDYLASGIDGAEVIVHGSAQDQLAQIMKSGRLVIHGDVGQTFMYAAKGGEVFVLGNAAGRPLINAVGKPQVVINGTCLDYLAESFMAGDAMNGGGFVVLNGVRFDEEGRLVDLDTPYVGGNLFSLASGGAIFLRDPRQTVGPDQLNGGEFTTFEARHWERIRPLLEENEQTFGIAVPRLLEVDGRQLSPEQVYRVIVPARHTALQPEEAWVRPE
jgi:glutamate synthase domain-containing protein 1/glutamate synthase domain-containing protein 3